MRWFFDYCIKHPTLTAILIISAVLMSVLGYLFLTLPELKENTPTKNAPPQKDDANVGNNILEQALMEETSSEKSAIEETEDSATEDTTEEPAIEEETDDTLPENIDNESKEPDMLLDDLNDVENAIDLYEEDETDHLARYSGKWVICRIITEEHSEAHTRNEEETYFFELYASNGEKLLSSEEFTSYNSALRGIETHKTNILRDNFKIVLSKKGEYVFKLLSGKNLLLCMGENYSTKAACEKAIQSTKRFAQTAVIDENIEDHVVKVPAEDENEPLPVFDGLNGKWIISTRKNVENEDIYYFELIADNGEKLLSSEDYATYIGAVNGVQTYKTNIKQGNFHVTLTKRGNYIYKLLNKNGQLLCLGENYRTKRRCLNAVEAVKYYADNSPVLTNIKF